MEISINHNSREVSEPCSVQQLLHSCFPEKTSGIAVAINQVVIPKPLWDSHLLQSNDKVTLIKATQGG